MKNENVGVALQMHVGGDAKQAFRFAWLWITSDATSPLLILSTKFLRVWWGVVCNHRTTPGYGPETTLYTNSKRICCSFPVIHLKYNHLYKGLL